MHCAMMKTNRTGQGASALAAGSRQRGYAALMTVAVLLLVVASIGLTHHRPRANAAIADDRTDFAMAEVKTALMGYAARQGVSRCSDPANVSACQAELASPGRVGEMPCPDMNNDGVAEASCSTDTLGRVPWQTLGIPDPRDSAGETLWYAVAKPFLNTASNPISGADGRINSGTFGNLVVRGKDGVEVSGTVVAVVFSPGAPLASQNRSRVESEFCATTARNEFRHLCASNYLETSLGMNNAAANGPYSVGIPSDSFNDRLIYISTAELMPMLEMRVGQELKSLLAAYRANSECGCYPWADSWKYSLGTADVGVNRGRFPSVAYPENWGDGKIPGLPKWITDNEWYNMAYYSGAKQETDEAGDRCYYCSANPTLTVQRAPASTASEPASALIFMPGLPPAGVTRPNNHPTATSNSTNETLANAIPAYLDDTLNNNKASCPGMSTEHANNTGGLTFQVAPASCDTYVRPTASALDRDRLHMITTTPYAHCAPIARMLIKAAPCLPDLAGCTALVDRLATCSIACTNAAAAMIVVPCLNTILSSNCDAPIAALKQC